MEHTVDLITVICGKEYCFEKWFGYIKTLLYKRKIKTWIIVNNSPRKFFENLQSKIIIEKIQNYVNVRYVDGPGKFFPPEGMDWRDPEICIGKHKSTGASFTMGFVASSADYVLTIDDDIVPPIGAFEKLLDYKLRNDGCVGIVGGLYFNHQGWNSDNPWRTRSQLKRTVVASIRKKDWLPAMIDDYWNNGVVESGYIGTGFTLYDCLYVRQCLPMQTIRNTEKGTIMGPDGHLCKQLREIYDKHTFVDTSILCEHYETETKEAGLGAKKFIENLNAVDDVILIGGLNSYHSRKKQYEESKKLAIKLNCKIIIVWLNNIKETCDFTDNFTEDIICIDLKEKEKEFLKILNPSRRIKKVLDEVFWSEKNKGNYLNYINLMHTTNKTLSLRNIKSKIVNIT
jgi:hypothetical protein